MLDSLYEKALQKKDDINEKLEDIENIERDVILKHWVDFPIEESPDEFTIAGGDGSLKKHKLLSSILYAIDAECLVYDKGLQKIENSDIDVIHHHKHAEDRIRSYMGIFEIKNGLKAFENYNIDLLLFDGSLLGNLIRPLPLENEVGHLLKEKIRDNYIPKLEELMNSNVEITSSKFSRDFKGENEITYLENLESLLVVCKLLKKKNIVAISKSSTSKDYFESKFPDIAIFDRNTRKQGYSKPLSINASDYKRDYFPVCNEYLRNLSFTIFYARLEDNKNILKFELPYEATENEVIKILMRIKKFSSEGYPIILKKAHNDVVIKKTDLLRLSRMLGLLEKTGREML